MANWLLGVISQPRLLTRWAQPSFLSLESGVHRAYSRGWEGTWDNDFLDFGVRTSLKTLSCSRPPSLSPSLPPVLPSLVTGTIRHQASQAASLRFSLDSSLSLTPAHQQSSRSYLPNMPQAPPLPLHSTNESKQRPLSPGHCRGS